MIIFTFDNSQSLINIFSALLTPTIAIIGGYIAYQQWLTNEKMRKQNLYDIRYDYIFKPILEICNKTIDSIQEDKLCNINELNALHNTKLSNIGKYCFLLKEDDFIKLMVHYDAIRGYVRDYKINPTISEQDKEYINLKLSRIYDMQRKYLSIEDEKYYNLWDCIAIISEKLYKFTALNLLVEKIAKSFQVKKNKGHNVRK